MATKQSSEGTTRREFLAVAGARPAEGKPRDMLRPTGREPTARPDKADVLAHTLIVAREYRAAADRLEAATRASDPLAAAVAGLGFGRGFNAGVWLCGALDRRDRVRGIGRYAPKGARS